MSTNKYIRIWVHICTVLGSLGTLFFNSYSLCTGENASRKIALAERRRIEARNLRAENKTPELLKKELKIALTSQNLSATQDLISHYPWLLWRPVIGEFKTPLLLAVDVYEKALSKTPVSSPEEIRAAEDIVKYLLETMAADATNPENTDIRLTFIPDREPDSSFQTFPGYITQALNNFPIQLQAVLEVLIGHGADTSEAFIKSTTSKHTEIFYFLLQRHKQNSKVLKEAIAELIGNTCKKTAINLQVLEVLLANIPDASERLSALLQLFEESTVLNELAKKLNRQTMPSFLELCRKYNIPVDIADPQGKTLRDYINNPSIGTLVNQNQSSDEEKTRIYTSPSYIHLFLQTNFACHTEAYQPASEDFSQYLTEKLKAIPVGSDLHEAIKEVFKENLQVITQRKFLKNIPAPCHAISVPLRTMWIATARHFLSDSQVLELSFRGNFVPGRLQTYESFFKAGINPGQLFNAYSQWGSSSQVKQTLFHRLVESISTKKAVSYRIFYEGVPDPKQLIKDMIDAAGNHISPEASPISAQGWRLLSATFIKVLIALTNFHDESMKECFRHAWRDLMFSPAEDPQDVFEFLQSLAPEMRKSFIRESLLRHDPLINPFLRYALGIKDPVYREEIIKLLVQDYKDQTALDLALAGVIGASSYCREQRRDAITLLMRYGANPFVQAGNGRILADLALEQDLLGVGEDSLPSDFYQQLLLADSHGRNRLMQLLSQSNPPITGIENILRRAPLEIRTQLLQATDARRETLLFYVLRLPASQHKDNLLHTLLDLQADPNVHSTHQWTPLLRATNQGDLQSVGALLVRHADQRKVNDQGETPLHIVMKKLVTPTQATLSILNALATNEFFADAINQQDTNGSTPLIILCRYGHPQIVSRFTQRLIERGANPAIRDNESKTAGDYALARGIEVPGLAPSSEYLSRAEAYAYARTRMQQALTDNDLDEVLGILFPQPTSRVHQQGIDNRLSLLMHGTSPEEMRRLRTRLVDATGQGHLMTFESYQNAVKHQMLAGLARGKIGDMQEVKDYASYMLELKNKRACSSGVIPQSPVLKLTLDDLAYIDLITQEGISLDINQFRRLVETLELNDVEHRIIQSFLEQSGPIDLNELSLAIQSKKSCRKRDRETFERENQE